MNLPLNRHNPDFFFDVGGFDHGDGVPGAAIEETAFGAFADAFLAADTEDRIDLDAAEGWMVFVGDPEHAVFDGAIFHAGRRAGTASAALGDDRQLLWFLLANGVDPLGAGFEFELVGNHPDGCFLDGCPWDAIAMVDTVEVEKEVGPMAF